MSPVPPIVDPATLIGWTGFAYETRQVAIKGLLVDNTTIARYYTVPALLDIGSQLCTRLHYTRPEFMRLVSCMFVSPIRCFSYIAVPEELIIG
jgi:hypothetical protein